MSGDIQAIEALFQTFRQGSAAGDAGKLKTVFHPQARLVGTAYDDGKPSVYNKGRDDFVADYVAEPLNDDGRYAARLASVQLLGADTAVAVVTEDFCWGKSSPQSFIDLLSLWKPQGEPWQIINKTFTQFPTKT